MKPATDSQSPAQIVETTTRRRILPADHTLSVESKTPELWSYLADVEVKREWDKHLVYLHRMEPSAPDGSGIPVQKCQQYLTMPDGQQVPVFDREEVELAILKHYGGKTFRLMVKRGAQLITKGMLFIDAAPRTIVPSATVVPGGQSSGATVRPIDSGNGDTAVVASRAFDALSNQERTSAEIGFRAMATAAEVMQRFANPPAASGNDSLLHQMMGAMIQRMFQPQPDPLELLTKVLALQASLNPTAQPNELMSRVMSAAVDKILNPSPAAAGAKLDTGAALVSMLPNIGGQFVEGLKAFAAAREAEARIVALQRGGVAQPPVEPGPNPQLIPPSHPAPTPAPAPAPTNGAPSMEFVEQKILDIMRQPVSAEQAADDAMTFLSALDPNSVGELAKLGEGGLVTFFQTRPILKQATNNMPRLLEFIRAFLKMYAEDQAAEPSKTTLPN